MLTVPLSLDQELIVASLCDQARDGTLVKLNWVSDTGGLPHLIHKLTKDLERDGHDTSSAVSIAVSAAKRFCAKGHADWCGAVADWNRKRAEAHATPNK